MTLVLCFLRALILIPLTMFAHRLFMQCYKTEVRPLICDGCVTPAIHSFTTTHVNMTHIYSICKASEPGFVCSMSFCSFVLLIRYFLIHMCVYHRYIYSAFVRFQPLPVRRFYSESMQRMAIRMNGEKVSLVVQISSNACDLWGCIYFIP